MTRYLLNSAVITAPGSYTYQLLGEDAASQWYASGPRPVSTIGYQETAEALSLLLGQDIPVQRQVIRMEPGDEALVFRLVLPPGSLRLEPGDKGRLHEIIHAGQWELGLLRRPC